MHLGHASPAPRHSFTMRLLGLYPNPNFTGCAVCLHELYHPSTHLIKLGMYLAPSDVPVMTRHAH
jgi:hypothetical protein